MKRLLVLTSLMAFALVASACDNDGDTNPSGTTNPRFTAILLPGNEVPPITSGGDAGTSGTAIVTLNLTRDGSGNITAATADFQATVTGFTQSSITNAHVHTGAAGVSGGVIVNSGGLAPGDVAVTNGSGTITKTNITDVSVDEAQAIINNPAGFYFNVHSSLNAGGAIRGQLVAQP